VMAEQDPLVGRLEIVPVAHRSAGVARRLSSANTPPGDEARVEPIAQQVGRGVATTSQMLLIFSPRLSAMPARQNAARMPRRPRKGEPESSSFRLFPSTRIVPPPKEAAADGGVHGIEAQTRRRPGPWCQKLWERDAVGNTGREPGAASYSRPTLAPAGARIEA